MGFWSRLFAPAPPRAPRWSGFTDGALFLEFAEALRERLAAAGFEVGTDAIATGELRLPHPKRGTQTWVLWGLAEACAKVAPEAWPKLMNQHLASAVGGGPPPGSPPLGPSPQPSDVVANLKVQVFATRWLASRGLAPEMLATRPLAPGLVLALVQALGDAAEVTLTREEAAWTGFSDDDLFRFAELRTLADDAPIAQFLQAPTAEGTWDLATSNGFYLSAVVLRALHLVKDAPRGILVAPITWHHWAQVVVTEATTRETIEAFAAFVRDLAGKLEVPESSRLGEAVFWWKDGAFTPVRAEGAEQIVIPPGLLGDPGAGSAG